MTCYIMREDRGEERRVGGVRESEGERGRGERRGERGIEREGRGEYGE